MGNTRDAANRYQVMARIEAKLHQRYVGGQADAGIEHGVAIGSRTRNVFGADVAAGAGLQFNHDILAEGVLHLVGDDPAKHVAGPAGGEGNDEGDTLRGVCRGEGGRQQQQRAQCALARCPYANRCASKRLGQQHVDGADNKVMAHGGPVLI